LVSVGLGVSSTRSAVGLTRECAMTLLTPVTTMLLGYLMIGESISPRESSVRS
jgi:drug/metabolite transporter (DMT)-like permease